MAWARQLPSGRWQGSYRDASGDVRTVSGGTFSHKAAAERAAGAAELEARSAGWRDPEAARRPLGDWIKDWWPTRQVEGSTLKSDVGRLNRHVLPRWQDVALCDITRQDVKAWAAELIAGDEDEGLRPLSVSTVTKITQILSSALFAAVDAEVLVANAASRLKLGGGMATPDRYLTRAEYAAAWSHLGAEFRPTADLLVATCMRWSEAVGLHHEGINRKTRIVNIEDTWEQATRTMKPYPKGGRARGLVLPSWIALPDYDDKPCRYEHKGAQCRSGLVLTMPSGAIMDQPVFRRAWSKACIEAGLGHVRIHDLRHTGASWLLQDGATLAEVGQRLGHISPTTTQRYARLSSNLSETVRRSIDTDPRVTPASAEVLVNGRAAAAGFTVVRGGRVG